MTYEEAHTWLENKQTMMTQNRWAFNSIDVEANGMAILALEKQIPMKPPVEGDGYYNGQLIFDTWLCPCCNEAYEVDYDKYAYCPNCGQAIDWSKE